MYTVCSSGLSTVIVTVSERKVLSNIPSACIENNFVQSCLLKSGNSVTNSFPSPKVKVTVPSGVMAYASLRLYLDF